MRLLDFINKVLNIHSEEIKENRQSNLKFKGYSQRGKNYFIVLHDEMKNIIANT